MALLELLQSLLQWLPSLLRSLSILRLPALRRLLSLWRLLSFRRLLSLWRLLSLRRLLSLGRLLSLQRLVELVGVTVVVFLLAEVFASFQCVLRPSILRPCTS
jgi:hypothetical protein